jgi:hypothetical protein
MKTTINSIFGAVVAVARTTEKAVNLAENEVDNLNEMQQIRLDLTREERKVQQAQFASTMRKAKRQAKVATA